MEKMPQKEGLTQVEAERRLSEKGLNVVSKPKELRIIDIAIEEMTEPMILLLLVVGFFYAIWGGIDDALTIISVIILLVAAEVWNEYRAKKAIGALATFAAPKTKVMRDGVITEVLTERIAPGDQLILSAGSRVAADAKVSESFSLQADESALTGESEPVEKKIGDIIYAGTLIVAGEGRAEAQKTGADTKIGKISATASQIKPPRTPLQLAMRDLSGKLVYVAIFFSILIPAIGVLRGFALRDMFLTGLALAFVVIPEELPIVITMTLGLGSYALSKNNFLIKKLKASEVLGDATVILTDKTGTITEGKMSVASVYPAGKEKEVISAALASMTEISLSYTDKAIIAAAKSKSIKRPEGNVVKERGFESGKKTRAVLRKTGEGYELSVIGAPEEVLALVKGSSGGAAQALASETSRGRRVIAIATKRITAKEAGMDIGKLENGLTLRGLISIDDPLRAGVRDTITAAQGAGIRTIMVTGDHPQTAAFIAEGAGIPAGKVITGDELDKISDEKLREVVGAVSVFARARPEHKYRLVEALQKNGEIVAVTGDGVNDSLALRAANIGIAMGIKGTDAAKESADIILADDNYSTIPRGIFEGRKLFDNLSKGIKYYLSIKVALVLIFLCALAVGAPFPFSPIQIIVLELFMDLAASAGFVAEPAEKSIYSRGPRDTHKPFMGRSMVSNMALASFCLTLAVLIPYFYAIGAGVAVVQAQTIAFSAWIIGHILMAFISRSSTETVFGVGLFTNKVMIVWAVAALGFLLLAINVPVITNNLGLAPLSAGQLGMVALECALVLSVLEVRKLLFRPKAVEAGLVARG